MKTLVISLCVLLTGCASVDRVVCYGTGTCDRDRNFSYAQSIHSNQNLNPSIPQTVVTSSGTYLIVPNYSSNSILPAAILQITK